MSAGTPLSLTRLLYFNSRWIVLEEDGVRAVDGPGAVSGPVWVLGDFGLADAGVETLNGSPSHAPALIERRLRHDGVLHGVGHVLIHETWRSGGVTRALYEALDVGAYADVVRVSGEHPDHCLLFSCIRVMRRLAGDGKNVVVVFRRGRRLDALLIVNGMAEGLAQAVGFSEDEHDMREAMSALTDALKDMIRAAGEAPERAIWRGWGVDDGGHLPCQLGESLGVDVSEGDARILVLDDVRIRSSVHDVFETLQVSDAINGKGEVALFMLERWLPTIGLGALAVSVAFLLAAGTWAYQTSGMNVRVRSLMGGGGDASVHEAMRVASDLRNPQAMAQMRFLSSLDDAMTSPDLRQIVRDIRAVVPADVRITHIRFAVKDGNPELEIRGASEGSLRHGIQNLRKMGASLRHLGYRSLNDQGEWLNAGNVFQLRLIPPGAVHG